MLIASKFVDINPLKMEIIIKNISHDEFTIQDIKEKENEILRAIHFDVTFPTVLDFLDHFITEFKNEHYKDMQKENIKQIEEIQNLSVFLAMMLSHDYDALQYK